LQLTANLTPPDPTDNAVIWSIGADENYVNTTSVSGCTIDIDGLLTAPANYTTGGDFTIFVFAKSNDGGAVTSKEITIMECLEDVIYNFSTAPLNTLSTSNFTEEITVGGLTFGSGSNLLSQAANAPAGSGLSNFTYCLRTNGGATTTTRYVVIPLKGPATITVIGASNNATATSITVTSTAASTASLGSMALPVWSNSALGSPTYTSETSGEHTVVLKSAASARIFAIKVEY